MNIGGIIFQALNAFAPTYPVIAPQGTAAPYITFHGIGGTDIMALAGSSGASRKVVQINFWSTSRKQANELADSAKTALAAVLIIGEKLDLPEDFEPDTKLFHISFSIAVWI